MAAQKVVVENFVTPAFRLSYPALFEAQEVMGNPNQKKYSVTMLFPKKEMVERLIKEGHAAAKLLDQTNLGGLKMVVQKIARANFGERDFKSLRFPKLRDGDQPKDSGKIDENEKGYFIVKASSNEKNKQGLANPKPQCLRANRTPITDPGELYPGCWVRAYISVAPFRHTTGDGIGLYLIGVQKVADDTAFSSRPRAEDVFDDVVSNEGGQTQAAPGTGAPAGNDLWAN